MRKPCGCKLNRPKDIASFSNVYKKGVVTEDDDENDVLAAMVKVLAIKICKNRALIPESSEAPFFDKSLIHAIREVSLETTEKNVMYAM